MVVAPVAPAARRLRVGGSASGPLAAGLGVEKARSWWFGFPRPPGRWRYSEATPAVLRWFPPAAEQAARYARRLNFHSGTPGSIFADLRLRAFLINAVTI
jgi:hypothetical protein